MSKSNATNAFNYDMGTPELENFIDTDPRVQERWRKYRQINSIHGDVRRIELDRTLNLVGPRKGATILEAGTGSCYLTIPLARGMNGEGLLISADVNAGGLQELMQKVENQEQESKTKLPIHAHHFSDDYFLAQKFPNAFAAKFDLVVSLATFHHFDTRASHIKSGSSGRINALKEFFTMLKPGGRLVIADVGHDTRTQRYFDAVDSPRHFAPLGHPHDFFTPREFRAILEDIGFAVVRSEIEDTPWVFESRDQAKLFLSRLHNAQCPMEESLGIASDVLGFKTAHGRYELGWQLMFIEAFKR